MNVGTGPATYYVVRSVPVRRRNDEPTCGMDDCMLLEHA